MTAIPSDCPLSAREFDVLGWLESGMTYKQIAAVAHVEPTTVRSHLHNIYGKLGVVNRAQAVLCAYDQGWLGELVHIGTDTDLLRRLTHATEELVLLVRERAKMTEWQKAYLSALDHANYAKTDEDKDEAYADLDGAFEAIRIEAGLPDRPRHKRDLLELIASTVQRVQADAEGSPVKIRRPHAIRRRTHP